MIELTSDQIAEIRGYLDEVGAGDEWLSAEESIRLDWMKTLLDARLNGQPDPPPIPEEEIAQARHPEQIREQTGTYWVWHGGLDGEYVDTGKPVDSFVMMLNKTMRRDTPLLSLIGRAPANPAMKLEWGWSKAGEE